MTNPKALTALFANVILGKATKADEFTLADIDPEELPIGLRDVFEYIANSPLDLNDPRLSENIVYEITSRFVKENYDNLPKGLESASGYFLSPAFYVRGPNDVDDKLIRIQSGHDDKSIHGRGDIIGSGV